MSLDIPPEAKRWEIVFSRFPATREARPVARPTAWGRKPEDSGNMAMARKRRKRKAGIEMTLQITVEATCDLEAKSCEKEREHHKNRSWMVIFHVLSRLSKWTLEMLCLNEMPWYAKCHTLQLPSSLLAPLSHTDGRTVPSWWHSWKRWCEGWRSGWNGWKVWHWKFYEPMWTVVAIINIITRSSPQLWVRLLPI